MLPSLNPLLWGENKGEGSVFNGQKCLYTEMEVKIYKSIIEIEEKEWDEITNNRLICTHKYLEAIEKSQINDCQFFYPVVYDGNKIVAHTCVYFITTELDTFAQGLLKKAIILFRNFYKNFLILRSLECGTPVALGTTISYREDIDKATALELICKEIEQLAKQLNIKVILFRDFYNDELVLYDHLLKFGYSRIHNLPGTKIEIKWKSFDEYLSAMRKRYRKEISLRRKKFSRDGITVEILKDFSNHGKDLERLWMKVYEQATEYKRERLPSAFFENINKYLRNKSSLLLVKKDGTPIAFSLLLFDRETLVPLFCGLDYTYNEEYCVYFNLFYKIIEIGIEEGMKDIDLGITTLEPKKEVGAEVVTQNMYMKHLNPLLNRIVPKLFDIMTPQDTTGPKRVFKTSSEGYGNL